jgi:hypothetical protein
MKVPPFEDSIHRVWGDRLLSFKEHAKTHRVGVTGAHVAPLPAGPTRTLQQKTAAR